MSQATVYKYRIWCVTDAKYEYTWGEDEPTTCPANTAHTIDADKTTVVEVNRPDAVLLKEEFSNPTGWELQNMLIVSRLIVVSARKRKESRGVHHRIDYPKIDNIHWKKHILIKKPTS